MSYNIALFDMDGTLLDTTQDLAASLTYAVHQLDQEASFTPTDAALFFGSGSTIALTRALAALKGASIHTLLALGDTLHAQDIGINPQEVQELDKVFSAHYQQHSNDHTRPYPGVISMLTSLQTAEVRCAVISNKMDSEVKRLTQLHFKDLILSAAGVRTGVARKPAPDVTLTALHELQIQMGTRKAHAVYVGDSEIDLLTAKNAGLDCIAVDWGFRTRSYLKQCGATRIVSSTSELVSAILDNK
ncbi:HAD family hydrolase [Atopobium fossor]|uniref:HAD family hydrolase n=1 Tax=Atopobium fossor TaxID=39487 RepID=UPI0003F92F66|nr:HAD family hydrolase [Atopobium fossor]